MAKKKSPQVLRGPELNNGMRFMMQWTHGLEGEAKEKFEEGLRIAFQGPVFERLREILREKQEALAKRQAGEQLFEENNWAYHQAHTMGRHHELNALLELIKGTIKNE